MTCRSATSLRPVRYYLAAAWRVACAQADAGAAVLVVLPWVLLLVEPLWVYSSLYRDTWAYFGAYQDLPTYLRTYPDSYSVSRLTTLLPGWLAYRWLHPGVANLALHMGVYYVAVMSAYAAVGRTVGWRAGYFAAALMGGHHFFLRAAGWDYVDGFVIAYFLLALAFLTEAARSRFWRAWAVATGCSAAAMVVANLGFLIMLIPIAGALAVHNRAGRRYTVEAAGFWVTVGFFGLLAGLEVTARALGGERVFLLPSLAFVRAFNGEMARVYIHPFDEWAGRAAWLVFPAAAAVGAAVMLARRGPAHQAISRYFQVALLGVTALLGLAQAAGRLGYLEAWFYASGTVMVAAFVAVGGQWGRWLDALPPGRFVVLAAVWTVAVVVSAVSPLRVPAAGWCSAVPLGVGFGCATAACLVPHVLPPRLLVGVAAAVLFAAANVVVRDQFRMGDSLSSGRTRIALDQCQALDPHRKAVFNAVVEASRWARAVDVPGRVWYCYDIGEPLGPVYDMIAHTNFHHLRIASDQFPKWNDWVDGGWGASGATVVVFAADPAAPGAAAAALRARGLDIEVGERIQFGWQDPVFVQATVLRVRPKG